ncbi:MAG: hypothetical protein ABSF55_01265 [Candidatus Staskawiczbacteria bacterium]|jgi:hypothetical protein
MEDRVLPSSIWTTIVNFFGRKVEPVVDRVVGSIVSQVAAAGHTTARWFITEGAKGHNGETNIYYGIEGAPTKNHIVINPDGTTKYLRENGQVSIANGERVGTSSAAVDEIMAGFATGIHVMLLF